MHACKTAILLFEIGGEKTTFFFRPTVFEGIMLLKMSINMVT